MSAEAHTRYTVAQKICCEGVWACCAVDVSIMWVMLWVMRV